MLRLYTKSRRPFLPPRTFSLLAPQNSTQPLSTPKPKHPPSPNAILHNPKPLLFPLPPPLYRKSLYALSATLICAATTLHLYADDRHLTDFQQTIDRSKASLCKIFDHMKQTGVAASVLLKSLASVLSSANQGVRSGFELRVGALLADISAANESRRSAIVSAGGGAVVDWLLETVASSRDPCGAQAESARALAYLIADPKVCEVVLGRPHAVPNLLRFIFSFQPQRSKKLYG